MNPLRAVTDDRVRLYRDADGWRAVYYDFRGLRRFVRIVATDETDAREKVHRIQRAILADPTLRDPTARPAAPVPTLAEWWDTWSAGATVSTRTMQGYRHQWAMLMRHFGKATALDVITPDDAAAWAKSLQDGRELISARSIVGRCKTLFREAVDRGLIASNPFARVRTGLPVVDREWTYTDRAAAARLIGAAGPVVARWLALCRWGGLRPGEARRLLWGDYDEPRRRLKVRGRTTTRTTKDRLRIVPVTPELAALLTPPGPSTARIVAGAKATLDAAVRTAFARARVTADPRTPLHSLRRSRATDLLADGIDVATVARIQGDSPIVVMRHYHTVTPAVERSITGLGTGTTAAHPDAEKPPRAPQTPNAKKPRNTGKHAKPR